MNRHERRKVAKRERRAIRQVSFDEMDSLCDIGVDAKVGQIVMIFANAKGRKVVEDLWPDVEWTTDEFFARVHSPDWMFTHVRVTKLPPHLEETVPLAFTSPESLGLAVAMALQRVAEPRRVAHWTGQGSDVTMEFYADVPRNRNLALSLFVEHVPAGTRIGAPARAS